MNFIRIWLIAFFAVGIIQVAGCSIATSPDMPVPERTLPAYLQGMTICDSISNTPRPFTNADGTSIARKYIEVHEREHAKRMNNHLGGCWGFQGRYNEDPGFRIREEAIAWCASVRAMLADSRDTVGIITEVASFFRPTIPDEWNWTDSKVLHALPCLPEKFRFSLPP